uniref:Uncharacterized protein n=1 Tax=Arundo donax TaxID=35708 RepID=A0A0A9DDD6_ARUDO
MTGWCHRLLVGGRLAASPPPDPAAATKEAACDQGGSLDEAAAVFEEECVVHTVPAAGSPSTRPPYLASPNPSNTVSPWPCLLHFQPLLAAALFPTLQ